MRVLFNKLWITLKDNYLKIIGITLCCIILLSGIPKWIKGDADESGGNTVVSVMFHVSTSSKEGQAYKKRIDAFNAAYKSEKIKAQATYIPRTSGSSANETALTTMKAEKKLPDIITFDSPKCSYYAAKDILYNITEMVDDIKDEFIKNSLNMYDGKIYGMPIQESSAGFFYNKNLFKAAGISDKEIAEYGDDTPWTYNEFLSVCERLSAVSQTCAVDMRFKSTKDETAPYLLYPFIYASGGEFCSKDGNTVSGYLNSDKTLSAFSFFKTLLDKKYTTYNVEANDFYNGKTGLFLSSGWTIPDLRNKNFIAFPSGEGWGLLPYPYEVRGCEASATGSWSFGITNNHHKDKSAARLLLKWLVTKESSQLITEHTGMISARLDVNVDRYDPNSPEQMLVNQLAKTGRARPAMVGYAVLSTTFNQIINELDERNDLMALLTEKATTLQETIKSY